MQETTMTAKFQNLHSFYFLIFVFFGLLLLLRSNIERPLDCRHKVRLGDSYGGWVTCKPIKSLAGRLVYTVGIGRNIEWDKEMMQEFGTRHHGWDPTPTAEDFFRKNPEPPGFTFHKFGLAPRDGNVTLKLPVGNQDSYTVMGYHEEAQPGTVTTVPMLSMGSMLKMLGHTKLAILKVDIEGAEFDVIAEWRRLKYSVPAEQVLIEFHDRYFRGHGNLVNTAIQQMKELGFQMVHKTKLEYTFAKREAMISFL